MIGTTVERLTAIRIQAEITLLNEQGETAGRRPVDFVVWEAEMPPEVREFVAQKANIPRG